MCIHVQAILVFLVWVFPATDTEHFVQVLYDEVIRMRFSYSGCTAFYIRSSFFVRVRPFSWSHCQGSYAIFIKPMRKDLSIISNKKTVHNC